MVNESITQITDFKTVLKDMEPWIKDPRYLRVGRELTNFKLRPREVLANWLICVVGNFYNGNDHMTFADHETGGDDGIILEKTTVIYVSTEHVFIREPKSVTSKTVEDLMVEAVKHKAKKGIPYAQGKHLVIFSEAIGMWYPKRVGRKIEGIHGCDHVWAVGLETSDETKYIYWVTGFTRQHSPAWKVFIDFDFTDWRVVTHRSLILDSTAESWILNL